MNSKHNSPSVRAFRKAFVQIAGPDSNIMSDARIGEMFSMILNTICKDREELAKKDLEAVESWDDVEVLIDEATSVYLQEDYEPIQNKVRTMLLEAVERAKDETGTFERP